MSTSTGPVGPVMASDSSAFGAVSLVDSTFVWLVVSTSVEAELTVAVLAVKPDRAAMTSMYTYQ